MHHAAFPDPTYSKMIVWGSTFSSTQEHSYVIELFSIWYAMWDTLRLSVIADPPLLTEQPRVRPELTLQKAELDQYWEPLTIPCCSDQSCTVHNSLCIGMHVRVKRCNFSFKMFPFCYSCLMNWPSDILAKTLVCLQWQNLIRQSTHNMMALNRTEITWNLVYSI